MYYPKSRRRFNPVSILGPFRLVDKWLVVIANVALFAARYIFPSPLDMTRATNKLIFMGIFVHNYLPLPHVSGKAIVGKCY